MNTKVEEITSIINRPRGASLVYHIGHITIDRAKHRVQHSTIVERTTDEREAVNDIAIIANRLQEQGHVALVHRRIGEHRYEYIAQRL